MVAIVEKSSAHSSEYPDRTPASVHTVTVPGPMKAAATNVLGPKYFLNGFFIVEYIVCMR